MLKLFCAVLLSSLLLFSSLRFSGRLDAVLHKMTTAPSLTIDLFVMSKCPDGVFAQSTFHAIQQHPDLRIDLQVQLSFITNDAHECMHGPSECTGNQVELAAQVVLGSGKERGVLTFTEAYGKEYARIGEPDEYLYRSFRAAGITEWQEETIMEIYREDGDNLLLQSAEYAKSRKAQYSATIMVHGREGVLGIRDSNSWKDLIPELGRGSVEEWVKYFNSLEAGL